MRRTYKSKRDTGGTFDARDAFVNLDEKSSVFDAFYIHSIKQTKRELSCVALSHHNGVSSNKVRKKKFVKRIVKELEPIRQRKTVSSSAYLTPDKSIRVNKVLDPFDMLLNSSSTLQDTSKTNKEDLFQKQMAKKENKVYTRKKQAKAKKVTYSPSRSNSAEYEKENTSGEFRSNITDIKTYELLVETEAAKSSNNESINKIVNNISLIKNFKHKVSIGSFNNSFKCDKNRLTRNLQSPMHQNSPLCSTPFKEKYRAVSIFKFSPITQKSPDYKTIIEEKGHHNTSIVFESKNLSPKGSQEPPASPLEHLPNLKHHEALVVGDKNRDYSNTKIYDYSIQNEIKSSNGEEQHSEDSIVSNIGEDSISTEPFFGFSNKSHQDYMNTNSVYMLECIQENNSMKKEYVDIIMNDSEICTSNMHCLDNSATSKECCNGNSTVNSYNSENESMYDTCNSGQSSIVDNYSITREPIVAIERMNDSVFMRYYEKMQRHQDEELSEQTDGDEFESLANDTDGEILNVSLSRESDCIEEKPNTILISDSSTTEDVLSSNDEDTECNNEEVCVSFVTTRRKKEIINDSMFIFDNSYGSSSTDCDKTVVSNTKNNLDKSYENKKLDQTNVNSHFDVEENSIEMFNPIDNPDVRIICRSSILHTERNSLSPRNSTCDMSSNESSWRNSTLNFVKRADRSGSKLSRQSKSAGLQKENIDLNLNDTSCNERVMIPTEMITTRKSSVLPIKITPVRSPKGDLTFRNIPDKRILRRTRQSSKLESNSTNSEIAPIQTTNNETMSENNETVVETNETAINNETVIEKNKTAIDSVDIDRHTWMFKEDTQVNMERSSYAGAELKPNIVLQPGKKWERSLSIYRRMTMVDNLDQSILEDECLQKKGRKYRQSIINTMEMQGCRDSLYNDSSINIRRSSIISKPSRPTIRFVKDPNGSRVSINTSSVYDHLKGFLNEECDDTVIELSKLSIADSEHEVTILDNFHETERVATARDYVLRRCNQTEPILFDECYPETALKNCRKIGEGVYGEVFLWRGRDGRARVMKIVPIAGTVKVNGEDQKDFHEIISEIVIAMELSALRAPIADIERQLDEGNDIHALELHAIQNATDIFNEVLAVRCVFGAYPSRLLDLWELYDECKGSENDNPAALPQDQRYIVLELANAGQDLESYQFANAQQAHALFQQIAFGLAVAEEAFQFEHRDLHWGNVLIAPTEQKFATFVLRGRTYRVPRSGVAATVIDYSLSRLSLPLQAARDSAALYNDLATDEQLFDAVGDYQFEVYRLMRDKLGNDWKNFEPYTNILWLHYTVDKMITALRYKRTNTKIHKHYIEKLKGIKDRILEYGSAVQYVLTDI